MNSPAPITEESFVRDEYPHGQDTKLTVWLWRLNNKIVFCEREHGLLRFCGFFDSKTKTPAQQFYLLNNPPSSYYWSMVTYADEELAIKDAKKFNGSVILEPYSEKHWFLEFSEIDDIIEYTMEYLKSNPEYNFGD